MGCIWSSRPCKRCIVCNCKQSRHSDFINNTCRRCLWKAESGPLVKIVPPRTIQYHETTSSFVNIYIPKENKSYVRGELPKRRPKTPNNKPQFGEYYCKPCGRSWKSLRSWSTKYQMCKRCKNHVYPHNLRMLLSSDYNTIEDPKEHERELCEMCKQLGYACKDYGKSVNRRH